MSKKVGRPKEYELDKQKEEQLLIFIKDYNENQNPYPRIRYKHIWEYSIALYNQNLFPFKTSYDFWKRKDRAGRQLVDIVNTVEQRKIYISKTENIDLINLKELVNKYGGKNKDILWENMKPYDMHVSRFIDRINKLQEENLNLKEQLSQRDISIKQISLTNNDLQKLLYSLFTYSNKENELVNMINTGQSKSKLINFALESTFEDPLAFILELTNHLDKPVNININKSDKSNVISFDNTSPNRLEKEPEYDL